MLKNGKENFGYSRINLHNISGRKGKAHMGL